MQVAKGHWAVVKMRNGIRSTFYCCWLYGCMNVLNITSNTQHFEAAYLILYHSVSEKNVSAWISPCWGKVPKAWRQHTSISAWMHLRQVLWIDFRVKLKLPEVTHSLGFILTKTTQTVPLLTVGTVVPFAHPGRETRSKLLSELSVFHACCQVDAQLGAPSLSFVF